MKLTNTQVIAECKKEAKKNGFVFSASSEFIDGEKAYQYTFSDGSLYRKCKLGLAYDIACGDELSTHKA